MPRLLDLRLLRIAGLRYTIRAAKLHRACAPVGCAQWQDASVPNEVSVWESRIPCQLAGWFVSAAVDSNHPALSMSLPLFCLRPFVLSTPFSAFSLFDAPGGRRSRRLVEAALAGCRSAGGLSKRWRSVEAGGLSKCRWRAVEVPAACRSGGLSKWRRLRRTSSILFQRFRLVPA